MRHPLDVAAAAKAALEEDELESPNGGDATIEYDDDSEPDIEPSAR